MLISAVSARQFDAGVATLTDLVRITNAGAQLQIVHEVPTPGYLWVSTGKLQTNTVQTIRDRLLAIRDPDVLAALDEVLTGFEPVSPRDFDGVEQDLEKARLFDAPE